MTKASILRVCGTCGADVQENLVGKRRCPFCSGKINKVEVELVIKKTTNIKLYRVEFEPLYPVPSGCIIAARNEEECMEIAKRTITHTKIISIEEIDITHPDVVFYESGEY